MQLAGRPLKPSMRMRASFASKILWIWIPALCFFLLPSVSTAEQKKLEPPPQEIPAPNAPLGPVPKPCFVVGNFAIPRFSQINPNIRCIPDGRQTFPPIPELSLNGTTYSSIDYQEEKHMSAVHFALQKLSPRNATRESSLEYLVTCVTLYESMQFALRSIGPRAPKNAIAIAKGILAFFAMNIAVLKQDVPQVKARLQSTLKNCVECSIQEKYNLIMFAATSGFDPEKYLRELEVSGCQSRQQCDTLQRMEADRRDSKNSAVLSTFLLKSEASTTGLKFCMISIMYFFSWLVIFASIWVL